MGTLDGPDNISLEDIVSPPKYDGQGLFMSIIASLISSVVSGVLILLFAYLLVGQFTIETGTSPVVIALITFFCLSIGNSLYYFFLSKIFPHIYTRGRTVFRELSYMSIILYIFLTPFYILTSEYGVTDSSLLFSFSMHILLNSLFLHIIIGVVSSYRYALLFVYGALIAFLLSSIVLILVEYSLTRSSIALFLLLGLVLVSQSTATTVIGIILWGYYRIYTVTGYDPFGMVFARIEQEEKVLESTASDMLTQFHKK